VLCLFRQLSNSGPLGYTHTVELLKHSLTHLATDVVFTQDPPCTCTMVHAFKSHLHHSVIH